jgi:hypothetical protein
MDWETCLCKSSVKCVSFWGFLRNMYTLSTQNMPSWDSLKILCAYAKQVSFWDSLRILYAHAKRISIWDSLRSLYAHAKHVSFWDSLRILYAHAKNVSFWDSPRDLFTLLMTDMFLFVMAWGTCIHFVCQMCISLRLLGKLICPSEAKCCVSFWVSLRNLFAFLKPNRYRPGISSEYCMHFLRHMSF